MGFKSAVARASKKSPSVRTTIPEKLAREMEIQPGDILDWELAQEKGRMIAKVKKLQ